MNVTQRERGFLNSIVSRYKPTSELFEYIKHWYPRGPWFVSLYTNPERQLIVRGYFDPDQEAKMRDWLAGLHYDRVQWFVVAAEVAEKCRYPAARRTES